MMMLLLNTIGSFELPIDPARAFRDSDLFYSSIISSFFLQESTTDAPSSMRSTNNNALMRFASFLWIFVLLVAAVLASNVGPNYRADDDAKTWENNYGSYPFLSYHSSNLTSPAVRKAHDSLQCYDEKYIFISPRGFRVSSPAVTILNNHGHLIWSQAVKGQPYNLKVQQYQGEQVLTFWVGDDAVGGHGEGYFYVVSIDKSAS
jgi:hypothetical protein